MMQSILTSIYAAYSANAALKAALPGGLFLEMAPQGTALPFGVYALVDGLPEYWLGGRRYELVRIQFDLYADTNAKRQTAYDKLIAVYDDATPTVTGYSSIIVERGFQQMLRDGDQDQIFRAIVAYDCRFLKT